MPQIELIRLRTLSPIHTGNLERRSADAKPAAILGSIRWWFEALVRGMDGYACDPTEGGCAFDTGTYSRSGSVEEGLRDVCPACRVFGCTGWGRKFKLVLVDWEGNVGRVLLSRPGVDFGLQLVILKPLLEEERWLLSRTLYLIGRYGSIGGRTTLKPPKFADYGLVRVLQNVDSRRTADEVSAWIKEIVAGSAKMAERLADVPAEHPNLKYFFFNVGYWLDRRRMNEVVAADGTGFMKGARGISKKLFSFSKGDSRRFWGYAANGAMLDLILNRLTAMNVRHTKAGREVLHEL